MELSEKKILVVGLGKSGLSASRWLVRQGAEVTVSDLKRAEDLDQGLRDESSALGIRIEAGGHQRESFLSAHMIVVSPGVPLDIEPLKAARKAGIPILGEMQLALQVLDVPFVAVTGTNGKSTVTTLVGDMISRAGLRAFVGGNIGTPLMDYISGREKADYAVLEVSSFQLDTMEDFSPTVAILLNISPDHLDRYPDYEAYVRSKFKIFEHQKPGQYAVLNAEDERLSRFVPKKGVSLLRYGRKGRNREAFVQGETLVAGLPGAEARHFDLKGFRLPGTHNLENLMAAVLAGLALNLPPGVLQESMSNFPGLPHRLELVGRIREVDFYDDSKATNVDAALRSVSTFDGGVILIAGGRDKGGDYGPLTKAAYGKVKKAVLLGEAKDLLARAFKDLIPCLTAGSMEEAVMQAFSSADRNDVVLLAPACSSFDMFSDYAHRGRVFREAVERLQHGAT